MYYPRLSTLLRTDICCYKRSTALKVVLKYVNKYEGVVLTVGSEAVTILPQDIPPYAVASHSMEGEKSGFRTFDARFQKMQAGDVTGGGKTHARTRSQKPKRPTEPLHTRIKRDTYDREPCGSLDGYNIRSYNKDGH